LGVLIIMTYKGNGQSNNTANFPATTNVKLVRTDEEWKKILSPEQYDVLRKKGTEQPYSGKYYLFNGKGTYICAACGEELFKSEVKFDNAGCGWPSFFNVADSSKVIYVNDKISGMVGTEVLCAKCGGHLGHVFDDSHTPTGLRYCINSISIEFKD